MPGPSIGSARPWSRRPDDAGALRWLAAALYELGDHTSTVAALTRVTELEPDDARAWRTLALLFKENREFERALPAYEQTLRLDPDQPPVRFELAETLVEMGRYREAERQLEACRGGASEPDRRTLLVHCLEFAGDREFGPCSRPASRNSPTIPACVAYRARIDLTEGRIAQAVEGFRPRAGRQPVPRASPLTSAAWLADARQNSPRARATWPGPRN